MNIKKLAGKKAGIMSHQFEKWIEEYSEGSLPPAQKQELERHLKQCPGCTQQLNLIRWTRNTIRIGAEEAPELTPSPWFAQRVAARIAQEQLPAFSFWNPMIRMAQQAIPLLAMLALVLGLFAYQQIFQVPSNQTDETTLSAYMDPTARWKDDLLSAASDQPTGTSRNLVNPSNKSNAPAGKEETGK
jgi:hypothetical protein